MDSRNIMLLLILIIIGYYLEMQWLVLMLAVVLFLIGLGSIKISSGKPKKVTVKKNPDVIYPVIYEDVGEPPLLYPEKMSVKVYDVTKKTNALEDALRGIGAGTKALVKFFTKGSKK